MTLRNKTLLITGASRGIGLAIALKAAKDGANIALIAKTWEPHATLPGTLQSAAFEIEQAGGNALPLVADIRNENLIASAIEQTAQKFGGIDIVVNNASAIALFDTNSISVKQFDLMHQVNQRGTFLVSKYALPFLKKSENPHILMLAPPLGLEPDWFSPHLAYSMAKFGMSICVLGLSAEWHEHHIAVNALWPRTMIATSAIRNLMGGEETIRKCRKPDIVADAAYALFQKQNCAISGQFLIDDTFLASEGVTDFDHYRMDLTQTLKPDFFIPTESVAPASVIPTLDPL